MAATYNTIPAATASDEQPKPKSSVSVKKVVVMAAAVSFILGSVAAAAIDNRSSRGDVTAFKSKDKAQCNSPCKKDKDCMKGANGGFIQCPTCWQVGTLHGGKNGPQCGPPADPPKPPAPPPKPSGGMCNKSCKKDKDCQKGGGFLQCPTCWQVGTLHGGKNGPQCGPPAKNPPKPPTPAPKPSGGMCKKSCKKDKDCQKGGGFLQCPTCWQVGTLHGGKNGPQCGPPAKNPPKPPTPAPKPSPKGGMCNKSCKKDKDCQKGGGFLQCPTCWAVGTRYGGKTAQCGPPA